MQPDPVTVFRALGNEARLRIAEALGEREACVSELRELVGMSWSTVSQHLTVLKNAGVIDCTRHGNQVLYRLTLPCVTTFVQCLTAASAAHHAMVRSCCT